MTKAPFTEGRAGGIRYWQAGSGEPVVAIADGEDVPTRAHVLLAENRRVIVLALPEDGGTPQQLADRIGAAISALDISRFDLLGEGAGAAVAVWLATSSSSEIGALVLAAPDGRPDEVWRTVQRPVLVLCGTRDQSDAGERCRATLSGCHFMFVYDAGRAIGAERPEALAFIAAEFFERRDLFLVSRERGAVFP